MFSLSVDAAALLPALQQTARFAAKVGTRPILDCVLFTVEADSVTLRASDLALGFTADPIPATVQAVGAICLPAASFLAALKAIGDGIITMREGDVNRVHLTAPGVAYTLIGLSAAEYPVRRPTEGGPCLLFKSADLATALAVVMPNIGTDDNRYGLNGLCLELSENTARFVATDGNRLAWCNVAAQGTITLTPHTLLARSVVTALTAMLDGGDGDVTFTPGGSYAEISIAGGVMLSQFVTGDFPDYSQVLPGTFGTRMTLNRVAFLRAVDRVLPFAGGSVAEVRFHVEADTLTLTARKIDQGDVTVTVVVDLVGDPVTTAFNGRYVREVLTTINTESVTFALSGVLGPAFLVSQGTPLDTTATRLNVLMPVRQE